MNAEHATLLDIERVTKRFGKTTALAGVDLRLSKGELVGAVGPDGAGKTTLLRAVAGVLPIDQGSIWFGGEKEGRTQAVHIGYVPQQASLYGDLSVDENLEFFAELFHVPRHVFRERRARMLELTRLDSRGHEPHALFRVRMYKKLAVACALIHAPTLLVLDEPTNGVDPVSRRELWAMFFELCRAGIGILVATAYLDEAVRCSRVALLHEGSVLIEGEPTALVKTFAEELWVATHPDQLRLPPEIEEHSQVLAVTPAGDGLRLVVSKAGAREMAKVLRKLGFELRQGRPDFEDLYLALVARKGRPHDNGN